MPQVSIRGRGKLVLRCIALFLIGLALVALFCVLFALPVGKSARLTEMVRGGAEVEPLASPAAWFSRVTVAVNCFGDGRTWDLSPLIGVSGVTAIDIAPGKIPVRGGAARRRCRIAPDDRFSFGKIPDLEIISLDSVDLPVSCFEDLEELRRLRAIVLRQVKITDGLLMAMAKSSTLETVVIADCGLTDENVQFLGDMKALSMLWLHGNDIEGEGIESLKALRHLRSFSIREQRLDFLKVVPAIQNLKGLEYLDIWIPAEVPAEVKADILGRLRRSIPNVELIGASERTEEEEKEGDEEKKGKEGK